MRRYVKQYISICLEYTLYKTPRGKKPRNLHPIQPGSRPFETWMMDHSGPFPRSSHGSQYIFVIVDDLTKFVKLYTSRCITTKIVLSQLDTFGLQVGLHKIIISDRGSTFTSHEFEQYCNINGIHHHLISVLHPRINGQVERANPSRF